ncbi:MAG TPA: surface-adhesin E family protein [Burkholderiales bacterium]|jgi:hypothetical protein|nr:surface-adhesin E family protein [Burkholderiales bacterium]
MRPVSILLATVLCAPLCAPAADWLVIASGYDQVTMVDRQSFRREGNRSEAWLMQNHDRRVNAPGLDRPYRSQRIHMVFDCGQHLLGADQRVLHSGTNGQGSVVANEQIKPDALRMAAPQTQVETMLLEMACAA